MEREQTGVETQGVNAGAGLNLVLLAMPGWDVAKPFHALAVVGGIAQEAGVRVYPYDMNVALYRHVDADDRVHWNEDHLRTWREPREAEAMWSRYEGWLHEYLDAILDRDRPGMVGFSVNQSTRAFSVFAAQYIRSRRPEIPILFGGVDCFPREYGQRFLSAGPDRDCDIICQGEAEISLSPYLREVAATGNWKTRLRGFAYYDGDQLIDTGEPELPTLKEKQPTPVYDRFDLSQYTEPGSLPFFLTRGCIYNCHFCSEKPNFKAFRARVAEEAVEEIRTVLPQVRHLSQRPLFQLSDSNINADIRVLRRFVDLLIEHRLEIRWAGQAHINANLTTEFIERLARAGLRAVFWGIESGSQHVVDLMNKRYRHTDARRVLRDCSRAGIYQAIPIILGFPGETPEDVAETVEFILEYQDLPGCRVLLPCQVLVRPNSPLHTRYTEFGLANTNYYDWHTSDGTNTLHVRIARRYVARQAQGNRELSEAGLVDTRDFAQIGLNVPATSRDLFRLLHEIAVRAGCPGRFYDGLARWEAEAGQGGATAADFAMAQCVWDRLDKDAPLGRVWVSRLVLQLLQELRQAVKQRSEQAAAVA